MTLRPLATLTARWPVLGEQPTVGMLMAAKRGRTVYRVVEVTRMNPDRNSGGYRYRLKCARLTRADVPEGIWIAEWKWDRREPRRHRLGSM